jgi:hypothetical protein
MCGPPLAQRPTASDVVRIASVLLVVIAVDDIVAR